MANLKNTVISDTGFFKLPAGDTAARPASPAATQLRFNTDTGELEQFRPGLGAWIAPSNTGVIATGGDAVYDVETEGTTYRVHVFTATGTSTFSVLQGGEAEYLIVAGGGGGASTSGGGTGAGGGGAGGLLFGTTQISSGSYSISVGAGGDSAIGGDNEDSGDNGSDSSAFGFTAIGGGGGGSTDRGSGKDGGSGGGGGGVSCPIPGGSGTSGQGNDGGSGCNSGNGAGGGGGGAGQAGESVGGNDSGGGKGGDGISLSITGTLNFYAGGGGGGADGVLGNGGLGGGGAGGQDKSASYKDAEDAVPNTGGGGGGGGSETFAGNGGSGIVVIRYPLRQNNPETAAGQDVRNGLVLDLDFAKPTVYSGSGSVVTDSRLNGIEGNLESSPLFVNARTHRSAFNFDGVDDWIRLDSFSAEFNRFTNASFVAFTRCTFRNQSGRGDVILSAHAGTSNNLRWQILPDRIFLSDITDGGDTTFSHPPVTSGAWHHYALTVEPSSNTITLYLDGNIVATDGFSSWTSSGSTTRVSIGQEWDSSPSEFFRGDIAYLKAYNKVLSNEEIQRDFQVNRWRFGV